MPAGTAVLCPKVSSTEAGFHWHKGSHTNILAQQSYGDETAQTPLMREVDHVRLHPHSRFSAALQHEIALYMQTGDDGKTS